MIYVPQIEYVDYRKTTNQSASNGATNVTWDNPLISKGKVINVTGSRIYVSSPGVYLFCSTVVWEFSLSRNIQENVFC